MVRHLQQQWERLSFNPFLINFVCIPKNCFMTTQKNRVRLNVSGKIFETTTTTLAITGRDSYFGPMFNENWDLQTNPAGEHFIDRNPRCFSVLLDLLRTGELYIPPNVHEKLFYREAQFYGLMNHVRSAKWGPFDGNRLQPSKSITGWAPGVGKVIRASPNGGCCVAHGSIAQIYDWMLEQHSSINLDYKFVKDAGWVGSVDPTGLVISTTGGMGLFNSTTGELKYKFDATYEGDVKSYHTGVMGFNNSGCKLFSSCRARSNNHEHGIGVWDQNTGQLVDFFNEPTWWSFEDANKLQWLNRSNCLLVAGFFNRTQCNSYFSLLDFRSKSVVRFCSNSGFEDIREDCQVEDAIVMEDSNSICAVNELGEIGFMDLGCKSWSVRWRRGSLMQRKMARLCYPKVVLHEGQLFSSMEDCISVFCGSNWGLTSKLRKSFGGSICDFSIGGDRPFVLHGEENVFDVWETPPSLIV